MRALLNGCCVFLVLFPRAEFAQVGSRPAGGAASATTRWKSSIEMTIGGADADEKSTFGSISGLAVDRSGRVFVGDRQDNHVQVFTRDGAYASTIGRKGAGPLEFNRLAAIAIGPDGLLWARDEGNGRFLAIDVAASPPRSVRNLQLRSFSSGNHTPIVFDNNGRMIDEGTWFDKATDSFRPLVLRRNPDGTVEHTDTIPVPAGANAGVHKMSEVQLDANGKEVGMSQYYVRQPHGPTWLRAYGPKGLRAEIVTSRYDIVIYDSNGKLLRTIKRTVPPVALSPAEKHRADSTIGAAKQRLPFGVPSSKAPVIGIKFTQEGHLWVERAVAEGRPREADVFDETGKFLATAEWPRNIEITADYRSTISGTTVHAISADSDGVTAIVRLKFR